MSRGIAVLYLAHQVIPAIAAARTWRADRGVASEDELAILADTPEDWSPTRIAEVRALLERLASPFPWVRVLPALSAEHRALFRPTASARTRADGIARLLGEPVPREIYYPLDSRFTPQSLAHAFPEAHRVTFGDALGVVYSPSYFERMAQPPLPRLARRIRAGVARAIGWLPPYAPPQTAALILPADPGGDVLPGRRLLVPSVSAVREILETMTTAVPELGAATDRFLAKAGPHTVMVLGNLTEAGITSDDGELSLYRRVLERHVPRGSAVLLKPHPGGDPQRVRALLETAGTTWRLEAMAPELAPVPIELAAKLVTSATVLSFSYTSISLRHVYGAPVIHVLDQALIDELVLPSKRAWMSESNRQYLEILGKLATWDGRSPLLA